MAEKKKAPATKSDDSVNEEKVVKPDTAQTKVKKTKAKVEPAETLAKAGKRSKKVQEEEAQKVAKEIKKTETKEQEAEEAEKPKVIQKPRIIKYSKNQKAARELVEAGKLYTVSEAIALLPKLSKTKFDATAEVHISLGIDPKKSDENLRTSAALPAGSGKTVNVAVITSDAEAAKAKKAGADSSDADQLLTEIGKGKFNFDVLIASPDKMGDLGRHAKVLGPKGLMPSPKNGTVTNNPAAMVEEIKKGRAEIKNDAQGIVHTAFGKLSFKPSDLEANLRAVLNAVKANKPAGAKGIYIKSIYLTSSMSPSVKLDPTEAFKNSKE